MGADYRDDVTSKVWTAVELEAMTPAQRHELFEASIVTDLDQAPPELLARTRRQVERLIAEADAASPS